MEFTYNYPRPSVTVDTVLFCKMNNNWSILLIKRGQEPFKNSWALPGGFVEIDENLMDAAKRELKEETNLSINNLSQFKTYGTIGRDPRGRTISIVYWAIVLEPNSTVRAGDDAKEAKWFLLKNLPILAFDHKNIVEDAITKLNSTN